MEGKKIETLGNRGLLHCCKSPPPNAGLGFAGARDASEATLNRASLLAAAAVSRGYVVVAGYANGVDLEAHKAALKAGGATVCVLAEGLGRFHMKRPVIAELDAGLRQGRVCFVSFVDFYQEWSVGAAFARNREICAMSKALIVLQAGKPSGTLAAGKEMLKMGKPVYLDYAPAAGYDELLAAGAVPFDCSTGGFPAELR